MLVPLRDDGANGVPVQTLDRIEVHARVSDGSDVITWFDLHSTVAPPTPTANWTHVHEGRIAAIRVAFDPRAALEAMATVGR